MPPRARREREAAGFSREAVPMGRWQARPRAGMLGSEDARTTAGNPIHTVQVRDLQYHLVLVLYRSLDLHSEVTAFSTLTTGGNTVPSPAWGFSPDKALHVVPNTPDRKQNSLSADGGESRPDGQLPRTPYLKYLLSGHLDTAVASLGLLQGELVSEDLQFLDQISLVPLGRQLLILHGALAGGRWWLAGLLQLALVT